MLIRSAVDSDSGQVSQIYNFYVATSHATFELEPISDQKMGGTIADLLSQGFPFLVGEVDGSIVGYVYGRPFRPRPGYRQTIETAVYVRDGLAGKGLGSRLYTAVFDEITGFHSAIATIALPNDPSVRLHEKFGFERAGHIREAGFKFGRWFDVGYWQRMLG